MSFNDNTMLTNKATSVISGLGDWATWAYSHAQIGHSPRSCCWLCRHR